MKKFAVILATVVLSMQTGFALDKYEYIREFKIDNNSWKIYKLENLKPSKKGQTTVFSLCENNSTNSSAFDLYLDFENSAIQHPNYKVIYESFEKNRFEANSGSYSAKFYTSKHYLSLLPYPTSIFYPGAIPGSFTIEFWLFPYKYFDHQYVMSYFGYNPSDELDQNKYGFSITIKNRKLVYSFTNFFWSYNNEPNSVSITEDDALTTYMWEHHAVTFNIMNGKIATFRNGIEQQTKWVTEGGKVLSPIFNPYIKDELSTPLIIGQSGFFSIDDVKISKTFIDSYNMHRFNNAQSVLITDIYKLSDNPIYLRGISFQTSIPKNCYAKYAYRISDFYFLPDDATIPWIYVQNGITSFPPLSAGGKYVQLMVVLYPYEDNDSPMSIEGITLKYTEDDSPDVPILLSLSPGDGEATVTWVPSTQEDIERYEIYYGTKQGFYICDDALTGPSPVSFAYKQTGTLQPVSFTIVGLNNETPYFVALKAVDRNGNKSAFSKEFYVRPSSIYNSAKYSIGR